MESMASHKRQRFFPARPVRDVLKFLLDFAQVYDGDGELVHAQLVAAPAHVKAFAQLMQGCIDDFEARYGVIDTEAPAAVQRPAG